MSLIDKVVAARKAAEAEHSNSDGSPTTEAQQAAILIAQVQAILGGETLEVKPTEDGQ